MRRQPGRFLKTNLLAMRLLLLSLIGILGFPIHVPAERPVGAMVPTRTLSSTRDWPTWRGDAARDARSAESLPDSLQLHWVRKLETPAPAWPASQHKIRFDASYQPVVAGKRLFVGSMLADRVMAYDTETGKELWRFYTDGPVRFAPLAWRDKVYFVCDDGNLYCLDAATGQSQWTVRGGPDRRLLLGNDRLISAWPARGAPVLWEEPNGKATVYFAAGIWPFMGIFLHAIDAETGATVWSNSGSGSVYVVQQHNSPAFAGVAPQGYLAATEDLLLVSGGRTVPAVYNRKTGEFLYFNVSSRVFGKDAGGYEVSVGGEFFFNHGCMYRLSDGEPILNLASRAAGAQTGAEDPTDRDPPSVAERKLVLGLSAQVIGDSVLALTDKSIDVYSLTPTRNEEVTKDAKGSEKKKVTYSLPRSQSIAAATPLKRLFCQAGTRVYGCGDGIIGAIDLPGSPRPGRLWTSKFAGEVWTMFPGDGKLFVVTTDGNVHCFAEPSDAAPVIHDLPAPRQATSDGVPPAGYAMMWGLSGDAFSALTLLAKDHHVIAIDPDAAKVAALRHRLDEAGLYGRRVHVLVGKPAEMRLPPYLASRIEFGDLAAAGLDQGEGAEFVRKVFHCLRPYGGTAVGAGSAEQRAAFERSINAAGLTGTVLAATPSALELRREGPLARSASWTHQYGDVANTVVSADDLVKPPLGLLWFGGLSHEDVLPRHGHGPSPQVIGGRLFIEGPDAVRAVDVYTGRLLWHRELKGLGKFYDNTAHQPGAGEIGGNYVSLADGIYVVHDSKCLRLDPATGQTVREFSLPQSDGQVPNWGYLGVYEDLLIAGSRPLGIAASKNEDELPTVQPNVRYASSSQELVVMDRHSGKVLWTRRAEQVFRHNAIVAGGGKVFCIDALSAANLALLKRRGEEESQPPRLLALDARSGQVLWQTAENVSGTWLGYSTEHEVLLEAGSPARDRAKDEATNGMTAYRGSDGQRLWQEPAKYKGTPMLHGATIYTDGGAFELLTGKPLQRTSPITGQSVKWTFARNYGCNTPIAGQHMLLFRSAAAGFYDLNADAGTGNFGGFKSGCTANLIPADGVLSAPDYTRTCTCSYQNQCSLALVPMDDVEVWTFQGYDKLAGPVKRLGINFGAPGDWPAPDGTLWLEYPAVGGKGPDLGIQVKGLKGSPTYFRRHATQIEGTHKQVTASGVENATSIEIPFDNKTDQKYTVRLYFAEPTASAAGQRIFDVTVQGKPAVSALDLVAQSAGQRRTFVKEIRGVAIREALSIELYPANTSKLPPLLCGVEAVMEE